MIRTLGAFTAFLLFALTCPATADDDLSARNRSIVAANSKAGAAFTVERDGSIRHLPSGADCPADFPNVHLADVYNYSSAAIGNDVSCDYARGDGQGGAISKLTIFLVKQAAGANLDSVFAEYEHEVRSAHPEAAEMPAALHITDQSTGKDNADYRATGYTVVLDQQKYHSELIVGLVKGWAVEVRATYPNAIIYVDKNTSRGEMANQLNDIKTPYLAFMRVHDSIGEVASSR
jgi:hypothetical protein